MGKKWKCVFPQKRLNITMLATWKKRKQRHLHQQHNRKENSTGVFFNTGLVKQTITHWDTNGNSWEWEALHAGAKYCDSTNKTIS